jgi:hypothetical protein
MLNGNRKLGHQEVANGGRRENLMVGRGFLLSSRGDARV